MQDNNKAIHLTIENFNGSVEHYYHFLLGFFVPLIQWHALAQQTTYIRSCAVLDPLIKELNLSGIVILDKELHHSLKSLDTFQGFFLEHQTIRGFDHPEKYSRDAFRYTRDVILDTINRESSIRESIKREVTSFFRWFRPIAKHTIVINRLPSNPFYESEGAEIKTSGATRRSIPNFDEILEALGDLNPIGVTLEGKTLREQVLLFQGANIIVAQHGASLANLIFCQEGATIVEIIPKNIGHVVHYFSLLCEVLGLHYIAIEQENAHSAVNTEEIVAALRKIRNNL